MIVGAAVTVRRLVVQMAATRVTVRPWMVLRAWAMDGLEHNGPPLGAVTLSGTNKAGFCFAKSRCSRFPAQVALYSKVPGSDANLNSRTSLITCCCIVESPWQ